MYVRGDGDNQLDGWLPPYNGAAGYFGAGYPTATWAAIMKRRPPGSADREVPAAGERPGQADRSRADPDLRTPAARTHTRDRLPSAPTSSAPTSSAPDEALVERPDLERSYPDTAPPPSTDPDTDPAHSGRASECPADGDARPLVGVTDSGRDDPEPVVHPTQDDPVAAALSRSVGGPLGDHAGQHRWWTPVRVVLAMVAVVCALGFVQKAPCYHTGWTNQQAQYSDLCYSDLPYLYVGRGFAELDWPYSDAITVRDRYDVMEYPVGIAYYAWGTAYLTHWLSGSPNVDDRGAFSQDQLSRDPQVRKETMIFVAVSAIGFALCALLAAWFLAGVHRRRPWDAALFAVSPVLLFEGLINWDMLAVVCVAGALWAHARGRPALTGVMLGLGTAMKLYPLFLLGGLFIVWGRERRWRDFAVATLSGLGTWAVVNAPGFLTGRHEWNVFWTFNSQRGADLGSVWLMVDQMTGITSAVHTINVVSWVLFSCWCLGVAWLGFLAPETPRLAQLGFLLVVGFLLVNKVYSPQYALWLLPLAVMARPRLRDQLVWQGGELFYFCAVWWYLARYLDPGGGGDAGFYWMAIIVRVVAQLYLVAIVVRDVIRPEYDVVRTARRRGDLSWWQLGGPGQLALGGRGRTPDSVS